MSTRYWVDTLCIRICLKMGSWLPSSREYPTPPVRRYDESRATGTHQITNSQTRRSATEAIPLYVRSVDHRYWPYSRSYSTQKTQIERIDADFLVFAINCWSAKPEQSSYNHDEIMIEVYRAIFSALESSLHLIRSVIDAGSLAQLTGSSGSISSWMISRWACDRPWEVPNWAQPHLRSIETGRYCWNSLQQRQHPQKPALRHPDPRFRDRQAW